MLKRVSLVAVAAALVAGLAVSSVQADTDRHTNILTFSRPMALPGVTLGSGTYIFELADPNASHDVVRVWSGNRKQLYYTGFTTRVARPRTMSPDGAVLIGEVGPGQPVPIMAWFPIGERDGHQFKY